MTPTDDMPEDSGAASQMSQGVVRHAAAQLYAGAFSDFITTRTALVKAAKAEGHKEAAREIAALRKPSVAAWALNQLVHRGDSVIESLADLGSRLRRATAQLDAAAIVGLREERDAVLTGLVAAATATSSELGQNISAAVESEVRNTGIAALADENAAAVLASGTLTRALSYSGFGEVDLSEAAATTSTGVVLTSIRGGRSQTQEATDAEEADETDEESPDRDLQGEAADHEAEPADDDEPDAADDEAADEEAANNGAAALAEAAAAAERDRRLSQAEDAVATAEKEIGRRRATVEAARNRTDATRARIQKLEDQLERARAEDEEALEKLTEAVRAAKLAATDLETAQEHLARLQDDGRVPAE